MTDFHELGLAPQIQLALDELGFTEPTAIQEEAIPPLLNGHDMIGQAQTGTGKTAAFGLPLLQYLDPDSEEVQAIILTPTRELCIQVTQAMRAFAEHLDVDIVAVFGGAPIRTQQAQLRSGAHVVVATVGRIKDLISRRSLVLTSARFVVLDEADEMLDLGFIEDVEKLLRMCPSGRQTALFSATMPPPIQRLAEGHMYDPVTVKVTPKQLTVDAISQAYLEVGAREKAERLVKLLQAEEPEQAIIFCRTKIGASKLESKLKDKGFAVKALHGDMSQGQRDGVMISFKEHRVPLLVATDIAARGLDIEHVTHVINYDLPNSTEAYVHRIGRTGRVGRTGRAITLVTPGEVPDIERIKTEAKTAIEVWESPEDRIEHAPRPRRGPRSAPAEDPAPAREAPAVADSAEKVETSGKGEAGANAKSSGHGAGAESSPGGSRSAAGDPGANERATDEPGAVEPAAGDPAAEKPADEGATDERADDDPAADRPTEDEPAGEPAEAGSNGGDAAKLFVNRGKRSGITEENLRWALSEGALLEEDDIADVRVLERFSFVELTEGQADRVIEFLDGTKLEGREIRLERARG